jgi:ribonuclease VapC
MTLFADASALIAIMTGEAGAERLADLIEADERCLCSALSSWETMAGLCRSYTFSVQAARLHVRTFLAACRFEFVAIGEPEVEVAADAYARYGKGRHKAALNMGDCFAYACAVTNRARLLCVGAEFGHTDIPLAT